MVILKKTKAFTLIELLISIAILLMMTGILLYDYPEYSIRVNLANMASKISLMLREAQIRGSAVDSGIANDVSGYGLDFKLVNSEIVFFNDHPTDFSKSIPLGDGLYDPATEEVSSSTLPKGFKISALCVYYDSLSAPICSDSATISEITVSFTRPSSLANIYKDNNSSKTYDSACVELQSPEYPKPGHVRSVEVFGSGRIVTSNEICPR